MRPFEPLPLAEKEVIQQCLDVLRYRQYRPERLHAGRFKSLDDQRVITGHATGTPDYVVTHSLYPAFYLEVKRPGEKPGPKQERCHVELGLNGLAVVWVDGYEKLLQFLDGHQELARLRWRAELEGKRT